VANCPFFGVTLYYRGLRKSHRVLRSYMQAFVQSVPVALEIDRCVILDCVYLADVLNKLMVMSMSDNVLF